MAERGPVRGTSLYLVLLSNGQIRGETLRNGAWPGGNIHPKRLGFPLSEQDAPGPFTHRPQTPQRSFQGAAAGTHLPSPTGSHTAAYTAKHGAFWMGALSLPSERFARFGNPARPGLKTANFAAFGSWPGALPKNAESLRDSDALMRVAVTRRRGPAGLRDPIAVSLTALIGFTVLADRDYRVRKKAHFVLCAELFCQLCLRLPPLCCTL